MTLQASGTIWLSQIRDEFRPGTAHLNLHAYYKDHGNTVITGNPENNAIPYNTPEARPGDPVNGKAIYFSHFYGGYKSYPGSWDSSTPQTTSVYVPSHAFLRLRVWGGGAAGQGWVGSYTTGTSGTLSRVLGWITGRGGQVLDVDGAGEDGNYANVTGGAANGGAPQFAGKKGGDGGYSRHEIGQGYAKNFTVTVGSCGTIPAYATAYPPPGPGGNGRVLIEWSV